MALYRVVYNMRALGTNRKFQVVGTDDALVGAKAEADAKLLLTVGTIESSVTSGPTATPSSTVNGGTTYEDAVLVLYKAGVYKTVLLENISTEYALPNTDGEIDITEDDLIAFATAWTDGSGANGYTLRSGHYKK